METISYDQVEDYIDLLKQEQEDADERFMFSDPFNIIAALEEEYGTPIAFIQN